MAKSNSTATLVGVGALVVAMAGIGVVGAATQASVSSTNGRDHSLVTQGSGGLVFKRDGTLSSQGSGGGMYLKRDGSLNTQGSGRLILKRDNTLADGGVAAQDSEVLAEPTAVLHRGPQRLAFEPESDGFAFENFAGGVGDHQHVARIDADSAASVLGSDHVCQSQAQPCQPNSKAKAWIAASNDLAKYGNCFGMATAALIGFEGNSLAGFSGPAGAQSLVGDARLQRSIATWQAAQDTVEVEKARQNVTANQALTKLSASFGQPGSDHYLLSVANRDPKTGDRTQGHVVVPFAVFAGADANSYIGVYDPNVPGTTTVVAIDSNTDTWRYEPGALTYDGSGQLQLIPASALTRQPLTPDLDIDTPATTDS